jgi:hypothetical protein
MTASLAAPYSLLKTLIQPTKDTGIALVSRGYLVFLEKVRTTQVFLRDSTVRTPCQRLRLYTAHSTQHTARCTLYSGAPLTAQPRQVVSHYPLLLFGGASLRVNHDTGRVGIVETDGQAWLEFKADTTVGMLFKVMMTLATLTALTTVRCGAE